MLIVRRIFKNTLALTIASAGQLIGNIILYFYLSRLLEAEGLGIYSTVLAVFQTACLGCGVGLNVLLPRELPKDLSQTNRYLIHSCILSFSTAIIMIVGLLVLIPHLGYLSETQTGLYIISFGLIPESILIVLISAFISHQRAEFTTITSIIVILGRILASLLALHLGSGVIDLIIIYTVFSYISVALNLYFIKRFITAIHWEFDKTFFLKLLGDVKAFAALAILNGLFSQSELLILSFISGETQVGYYSAALKLVTIWAMVPSSYMTATFPVLSTAYQESWQKAVNLQNRSVKYMLAAALPLAVGLTVTARMIIPLIYGSGFDESISTLRVLAWYLPLVFCNMVLWRILVVRDKQWIVFRIQLITEVIQALLAIALIPLLGCQGAALALLGGNLAYTLLHIYYIRRDQIPLPLVQICWRFVFASVMMGISSWLLATWLPLIMVVPLSAFIYLGMLWILHAFSSEDLILFKQMLSMSKRTQVAKQEPALIDLNK